jgi:uncharacterized protein YndB with AHSA1/START domain
MATITNTIDVKASPDDVWAVLADMSATRQWLPGVVSARMDGDLRICQMADGQEVHEQISDVSPERRSFRFDHLRVPLPVHRSGGTFTVTAGLSADTATVVLETTFEPMEPSRADDLTAMIHGAFQESLKSLRRLIEDKVTWDAH